MCEIFDNFALDFDFFNKIFTFSMIFDIILVLFFLYFLYYLIKKNKTHSSDYKYIIFMFVMIIVKIVVFFILRYLDLNIFNSINEMESISKDLQSQYKIYSQEVWWTTTVLLICAAIIMRF